jgi:hypothetical protein
MDSTGCESFVKRKEKERNLRAAAAAAAAARKTDFPSGATLGCPGALKRPSAIASSCKESTGKGKVVANHGAFLPFHS